MRTIPIYGGKRARVDDDDYPWLKKLRWYLNAYGYAVSDGMLMHRLIMKPAQGMIVHHRNRNRLDNRRENLEILDHLHNSWLAKRTKSPGASSRYFGVAFYRWTGKWLAMTTNRGRTVRIGEFDTELEAARAFDAWARKARGSYARLNFPQQIATNST